MQRGAAAADAVVIEDSPQGSPGLGCWWTCFWGALARPLLSPCVMEEAAEKVSPGKMGLVSPLWGASEHLSQAIITAVDACCHISLSLSQ